MQNDIETIINLVKSDVIPVPDSKSALIELLEGIRKTTDARESEIEIEIETNVKYWLYLITKNKSYAPASHIFKHKWICLRLLFEAVSNEEWFKNEAKRMGVCGGELFYLAMSQLIDDGLVKVSLTGRKVKPTAMHWLFEFDLNKHK